MKKFFIVNTEPNCNILGLDPIIHAFWDEEMEKLTGRRLTVFAYQIADGVMNAIPDKEDQRMNYAVLISRRENDEVLASTEARNWFKENVEVEEVDLNLKELSGTVACTGRIKIVRGRAKIVMNSSENDKVKEGDIMLSTNTVPDHLPAMCRAEAIITQVGGLTCHAAIVSRELNKPCLIGVKHLLEIFKDGDVVEIDMTHGIIKKL